MRYSIEIDAFIDFMRSTAKKVISSNNDIEVLRKALEEYKKIKLNVNPKEIESMSGDSFGLDVRFEKVLKLGFERVEARKIKDSSF